MDLGTPINYIILVITKLIEFFQNAAVITASAALLGVHLSNKASERRIAIQFEKEAKARAIALKSEKIEELFIILKSIEVYIYNVSRIMRPYFHEEINHDEAMLYIDKYLEAPIDENERLHAVVTLHFPSLKNELENFVNARSKIIYAVDRFTRKNKLTPAQFNQLLKNFNNHSNIFTDKIVKVATEIN